MRVFGFHPVREALRHRPAEVSRVLTSRGRSDRRFQQIADLCERHQIPLEPAPESLLTKLAGAVHNGLVAELSAVSAKAGAADPNLLLLAEDLQDPRNLGALLRVCEGAGVGRVLLRDRGSAPLSPAAVKTSAGAADWINLERVTNTAREIEALKKQGFWVYGLAAGGDPPWEVDLTGKVLLCLGGEEKGLRALTRKHCDRTLGLPMLGQVESLNLATAAAAVLYEAVRQRSQA